MYCPEIMHLVKRWFRFLTPAHIAWIKTSRSLTPVGAHSCSFVQHCLCFRTHIQNLVTHTKNTPLLVSAGPGQINVWTHKRKSDSKTDNYKHKFMHLHTHTSDCGSAESSTYPMPACQSGLKAAEAVMW